MGWNVRGNGRDPNMIPILLRMGLDEFSMRPSAILPARKFIRQLNYGELKGV